MKITYRLIDSDGIRTSNVETDIRNIIENKISTIETDDDSSGNEGEDNF